MGTRLNLGMAILLGLLLFTPSISAQRRGSTVDGCVDVNCPVDEDNHSLSACRVQDTVLQGVGISTLKSDLLGTHPTWTLGVSLFDTATSYRDGGTVQRIFYLGTQPGDPIYDSDATGCAVMILANKGGGNATLFSGGHANRNGGWWGSSCNQPGENDTSTVGLPEDCLTALEQRATGALLGSDSDSCSNIADALNAETIDACNPNGTADTSDGQTSFLGVDSTVYTIPLTGQDAFKPISNGENATSNCWPTLPQSNELTEVFAFNITAAELDGVDMALKGITPIMNVWHAGGSTEFEALCISPPLLTTHDAKTLNGNIGTVVGPSGWVTALAIVVVIMYY